MTIWLQVLVSVGTAAATITGALYLLRSQRDKLAAETTGINLSNQADQISMLEARIRRLENDAKGLHDELVTQRQKRYDLQDALEAEIRHREHLEGRIVELEGHLTTLGIDPATIGGP